MRSTGFRGAAVLVTIAALNGCSNESHDARDPIKMDRYLQELFDQPDDFLLVDKIFVRISETCDGSDPRAISKLPPPQKVVLDVWGSGGIIDNGGFKYLFEADLSDIAGIADSFESIEAPEAARVFRAALAIFPNSKPHADIEQRLTYLEQLGPSAAETLQRLSEEIWVCDRGTKRKLATYVRANAGTFASLPPSQWEDLHELRSHKLPPPRPTAEPEMVVRWLESMGASVWRWKDAFPDTKATAPVPTGNPIVTVWLPEYRNSIDQDLEFLAQCQSLNSLRELRAESTYLSSEGLKHFAGFPDLRNLSLSETEIEETDLQWLAPLSKLTTLKLADTGIGNSGLARLAALKSLEELDLSHTAIDDQGLAELAGVTNLRSITLRNARIDGTGLRFLVNLPLETLELMGSRVTREGLSTLRELRRLKSLELRDTEANDAALEHLSQLPLLEMLNLDGTSITDAGLIHLAGIKNLKSLHLSVTALEGHGLRHLANLSKLNDLHLFGTRCDDSGIAHLAQLSSLESLWLGNTRITDDCFKSLSKLRRLRKLGINEPGIVGGVAIRQLDQVTALEWISLPEGLKGNANVRYLQGKLRQAEFSFY